RLDLTADPLPGRLEAFSTHGIALRHALALARMLGDVPPKVAFYGIVGRNFAHGTELSPEVAAAARRLLRRLRRLCIWRR
ncbi:MAG: hypothetical protein NZ696_00965, partial [Thermomicrobium sp.]|nr:hypothetical protein [Thermomicrobium sp.]